MRCSSSGLPATGAEAISRLWKRWSPETGPTSSSASEAISARSHSSRRPMRPASARASSRRSPTSRFIRFELRRAEETAATSSSEPSSVASEASSSSRLARMLVSGVRSSCEASATNSRCRLIVLSVSDRAASSSPKHLIERPRQLGDLVVALRLGDPARGVSRRGDLAGGGRQRRDRPHRPVGDSHAGDPGEDRADRHPHGRGTARAARSSRRPRIRGARTGGRAGGGRGRS